MVLQHLRFKKKKKLWKTFVHIKPSGFIDVQLTQHPIFQDCYSSKESLMILIILSLPKLSCIIHFIPFIIPFEVFRLNSSVVITYLRLICTHTHTHKPTHENCAHLHHLSQVLTCSSIGTRTLSFLSKYTL